MKKVTISFSTDDYNQIVSISKKLDIKPTSYIRNVALGNITDVNFLNNIGLIPLVRSLNNLKSSL